MSVGDNRRVADWPPRPLAGCCTGTLDDLAPNERRVAFTFGSTRYLLDEAWEYDLTTDSARRLFGADGRIEELRYAPTGGWLAYQVSTGTRTDVFVRPHPGPGSPVRVADGGGRMPRWRADGSELFYLDPSGNVVSVAVRGDATPIFGPPQVQVPTEALFGRFVNGFDVSPDGQDLALAVGAYVESFLLVLDWHGLLESGRK